MAWIKVARRTGFAVCPMCGNRGFDLEPGEDVHDENAKIKCGNCAYVCSANEWHIVSEDRSQTP
ncbi:hypothetical protein MPL3365_210118 [Mesorhizobium plurifarium]|uniref:4Fe-4S ferredoxin-type domain-containing protein n=1 Tax=Mesorhizobium plurifarium TaxID=69974 RepID=A0A090GUB6_MESPL|nr:hypothetical protein MPL3365_210118 [Mesorhizobium plurifarium]